MHLKKTNPYSVKKALLVKPLTTDTHNNPNQDPTVVKPFTQTQPSFPAQPQSLLKSPPSLALPQSPHHNRKPKPRPCRQTGPSHTTLLNHSQSHHCRPYTASKLIPSPFALCCSPPIPQLISGVNANGFTRCLLAIFSSYYFFNYYYLILSLC